MATSEQAAVQVRCPECGGVKELPCDVASCMADDCQGLTPCNTCGGEGTCSREEALEAWPGGEARQLWHAVEAAKDPR